MAAADGQVQNPSSRQPRVAAVSPPRVRSSPPTAASDVRGSRLPAADGCAVHRSAVHGSSAHGSPKIESVGHAHARAPAGSGSSVGRSMRRCSTPSPTPRRCTTSTCSPPTRRRSVGCTTRASSWSATWRPAPGRTTDPTQRNTTRASSATQSTVPPRTLRRHPPDRRTAADHRCPARSRRVEGLRWDRTGSRRHLQRVRHRVPADAGTTSWPSTVLSPTLPMHEGCRSV